MVYKTHLPIVRNSNYVRVENTKFRIFDMKTETASLRNVVFSSYLEFQTMDSVHIPSGCE
jgi:hypothetical protein